MQKTPYVFPIVGGRKVEHLLANLEALEITLTDEHIKSLESEVEFDPGFPTSFIVCLFYHMHYYVPLTGTSFHRETEAILCSSWRPAATLTGLSFNPCTHRLESSRHLRRSC